MVSITHKNKCMFLNYVVSNDNINLVLLIQQGEWHFATFRASRDHPYSSTPIIDVIMGKFEWAWMIVFYLMKCNVCRIIEEYLLRHHIGIVINLYLTGNIHLHLPNKLYFFLVNLPITNLQGTLRHIHENYIPKGYVWACVHVSYCLQHDIKWRIHFYLCIW